jgi:hypothetical protein
VKHLPANLLRIATLAVVLSCIANAVARETMPFDEVQPGMRGVGRTVFSGTRIESFDVEILGKLSNIGPDQNLILARLSGGPLERTGVLAGMSGSPVEIDGKLVGAVAYSWGFTTEPIAGITPIEEMLRIADLEAPPGQRAGLLAEGREAIARLHSPQSLSSFFDDRWRALIPAHGGWPASIPLSVSGLGARGLARVSPALTEAGFLPVQAGTAAANSGDGTREPLQPGSAIGLQLVSGDVEMTATGTVTWVDGNRLLGLGHPLFGLGAIDLPMTAARVETILPSLHQSMRLATPTGTIGALRQDRASGIFGSIGAVPRTIPVRLLFTGSGGIEHAFAFELADDPLLSPLLLYASLNGILAGKERNFGNATIRLRFGSVIKMAEGDDVELDNLFTGPAASDLGTGLPAYILYILMNNVWDQPQIAGVNLLLDYEVEPRTARVRRVSLDRYRVAPGDTVEVSVVLGAYRGRDQVLKRRIVIPPEVPAGKLDLTVGGALAASRSAAQSDEMLPRDLGELVELINRLRRNDMVYILATREEAGVVVHGSRLPNLPPSAETLLSRPKRSSGTEQTVERNILEEGIVTDHVVEGATRVQLTVVAP